MNLKISPFCHYTKTRSNHPDGFCLFSLLLTLLLIVVGTGSTTARSPASIAPLLPHSFTQFPPFWWSGSGVVVVVRTGVTPPPPPWLSHFSFSLSVHLSLSSLGCWGRDCKEPKEEPPFFVFCQRKGGSPLLVLFFPSFLLFQACTTINTTRLILYLIF